LSAHDDEAKRIRAEYVRRDLESGPDRYSLTAPANLFARQGQQAALLRGLTRAHLLPLAKRRILEVGCGRGQWISVFEDFGAQREHIAGIDLDQARIADARKRFGGADLRDGDATRLPWSSGSFDIVFQSTVFTSILDAEVRRMVAAEMSRVLAPDGAIVWYDFRYNNVANPSVRGVEASELAALFPRCTIELERVTLAPPLARLLVPRSWFLASWIERFRLLNTHYLGVIRPLDRHDNLV
jgi:ubiquinone/menaquinone biosynthesis C-methylase UbiE